MNDESYRIQATISGEDNDFLDKINQNRNEAIRTLIKIVKEYNLRIEIRQVLQNICIGFLSLSIFFIISIWINYLFLIIALIIFGYECYDVGKINKIRGLNRK